MNLDMFGSTPVANIAPVALAECDSSPADVIVADFPEALSSIFGTAPIVIPEPAAVAILFTMLEPGWYFDIPARHYHWLPYVSNSYLSRLDNCPAKAKAVQNETPTLIKGRGLHAITLEGEEVFNREFAVLPEGCGGNSKIAKEAKASFIQGNSGKDLLSAGDYETVSGMSKSVNLHPSAKRLLSGGFREVTIIWDHVINTAVSGKVSIRMKVRIDLIPTEAHGVLVDLKSTKSADEGDFLRSVKTYGYHRQGAVYLDGINAVCRQAQKAGMPCPFPQEFDAFVLVAVEPVEPHRCEVYELDKEAGGILEFGREDYIRLLYVEQQCRVNGVWPAYKNAGAAVLYKPPYWAVV